jgi:hypothetical protein
MTIVIQQNSAVLKVTSDGNRPNCKLFPETAFFSLREDTSRQAISIVGTVQATKAPIDTIARWDIGFIQLMNESVSSYYFAGPDSSDGSVIIDFAENPSQYILDCEDNSAPLRNSPPPAQIAAPFPGTAMRVVYSATTNDHPVDTMELIWTNFATHKDNYLIRAQKKIDVCTAFVTRDRNSSSPGPFSILAYVNWHAAWDFKLTHHPETGRPPGVTTLQATFTADPPVRGAPADKNVARQIANASASDKNFNDIAKAQLHSVINATANTNWIKSYETRDARVNAAPQFTR